MKLKQIAFVLPMLGLTAAAMAGNPGNNMVMPSGINLIAPASVGTWSFGVEALYMQSSDNFQYTAIANPPLDNDFDNQTVGNTTNWGISADIGYTFAGSSRDVNLSYTHLDFDNAAAVNIPDSVVIIGNGGGGGAPLANSASDSSDQDLNSANLTFGQLFHVGSRVDLHPFAGVQFTDFDNTQKPDYSAAIPGVFSLGIDAKLNNGFTGAGPRFGVDGAIHLGAGFSVVGTAAGALLVGEMSSNLTSQVTINDTFTGTNETTVDDYTAIVPELDAKLGLDYMYAFNSIVSMNAQVGYEIVNYFNMVNMDVWDITQTNSINNTSDFNYYGPYFRLQLNIA
ncbi:MAG: Lpg1974 family pore-forming outer membrane protein [Gammaproteobacteria bacterium]